MFTLKDGAFQSRKRTYETQFFLVRTFLRAIGECAEYYHKERNHQGRDDVLLLPSPRLEQKRDHPIQQKKLGGLPKYYCQKAT